MANSILRKREIAMRTHQELYPEKRIVYKCEWENCPQCGEPLTTEYTSGWKTIQTMSGSLTIAQRPRCCVNAVGGLDI
jgi:hypothetical protein